jgi:hypothetical protein
MYAQIVLEAALSVQPPNNNNNNNMNVNNMDASQAQGLCVDRVVTVVVGDDRWIECTQSRRQQWSSDDLPSRLP